MIKAQNFGLLAAVVFAVGMVGFNLSDGTFVLNQADSSAMVSTAGMVGHIEVIHADSEGNILSYLQTDNSITNKGVNCTMVMLFGAPVDAEQCNGAQTAGSYDIIAVDNTATLSSTLDLNANKTANQVRANGFIPVDDSVVTITQVADGNTAGEVDGIVRIAKTFTASGTETIFGASLINSTTTSYGLFAYKDFSGGSILLNSADTLTVNWDITINGGGAES